MKRQNIRTLSLVIITLTYLIIGAAVFDHFESTHEAHLHDQLRKNISKFQQKYKMNDTEFNRLWNKILDKKPYSAGNQWKFVGSLYFCTVVVTLIGYGHSTPRTLSGKIFCIFYTLFGIPIFLIMFQSVGERLNSFIIFSLGRLKKRLRFKNQKVGMFELISVEGCFSVTIIIIASYVFMHNEGWTYFDAIYYCFITLTTIGFGDYVPLQQNNFLSNNLTYASFTILFILVGLTTLASSMNLLVLRLATINAEEQVQERLEQAEARRNAVHLEGDVISGNSRLFAQPEKPEQFETISVCSCACMDYKLFHRKRKKGRLPNGRKYFTMPAIFQRRPSPAKKLFGKKHASISSNNEIELECTDKSRAYMANNLQRNSI
ncbi:Two pore potassium channel sup-9 [Brachionus plicatilis]|uniref:Two pore potassium channel sup-9 n=1 Tax=Brachionus plicatilis TaxID=10195 RepID=A0A3M7Q5T6_BRAPC|nr:Two pore potassium channel sup-9 [Brachionus plicatilis]